MYPKSMKEGDVVQPVDVVVDAFGEAEEGLYDHEGEKGSSAWIEKLRSRCDESHDPSVQLMLVLVDLFHHRPNREQQHCHK